MTSIELTNEKINGEGGLSLIGKAIAKFGKFTRNILRPSGASNQFRRDRIPDRDILVSTLGLMVQGRSNYGDISQFRHDPDSVDPSGDQPHDDYEFFADVLNLDLGVPSEETLRQRLELLATTPDQATEPSLAEERDAVVTVAQETIRQVEETSLALMQVCPPTPIRIKAGRKYLPCDIDVSPFDNGGSKRENVGRTYKGCDGFAPIFAYFGSEGWAIHHELRPGTQHCQKGTPDFLRQTIQRMRVVEPSRPILVRMDSGNDSAENIAILREAEGIDFLIKRNPRREDPVKWLSHAMALGTPQCPREGKEVYIGTVEHLRPGGEKSDQPTTTVVYQIIHRTIDKHGQELLIPTIEVNTWWTSLGDAPATVISLYQDHGTSEQFHSELKSDMNLERFASKDYRVNVLLLHLGVLAYNLLRLIERQAVAVREAKPETWPRRVKDVYRRRVGSIIRDVIRMGSKVVRHAGKRILKLPRSWPWSRVLIEIDARLAAL